MNARRNRRRHEGSDKHDPNSGIFPIPDSARVARRGSTRVEVTLADVAPRGRGGFRPSEG
jgi:hypothetical protein